MNNVARFVIRGENGKGNLILGSMFDLPEAQKLLKPDTVYEIVEILGELVIKPIGKSEIKDSSNRTGATWNNSVSDILGYTQGKKYLLTESEFDSLVN